MEEHFKNKLKEHKVDWDKEELLGTLKEELDHKKKRYGLTKFLCLLVFLLGIFWVWNRSSFNDSNKATAIQANSKVQQSDLDLLEKESDQVIAGKKNKQPEANSMLPKLEIIKSEEALGLSSLEEVPTGSDQLQMDSRILPLDLDQDPANSEMKDMQITNRSTGNSAIVNIENVNLVIDYSNGSLSNSEQKEEQSLDLSEAQVSQLPENVVALDDLFNARNLGNTSFNEDGVNQLRLSSIPRLKLKLIDIDLVQVIPPTLSPIDISKQMEQIKDSSDESASSLLYYSISTDFGLANRQRKFNSNNSTFIKRLEENEATEKTLFTFNAGVNMAYQHHSGFSIQTGFEYSEIKELFDYTDTSEETMRLPSENLSYIILSNMNMDTTFVGDSITVLRTTDRTVRHFNKHVLYSIPLQLGYQFSLEKVNLKSTVGLNYTFAHNFDGKMNHVYENGGSEILESNQLVGFALKSRIGVQLGLTMEYPFMKHNHFYFSTIYRRSPTLSLNVIDQNYHSISLGAGVKFSLGGS